ncbi:hypothetical protein FRB95_013329 [Tulasnella sp. JGI-2019a]|nr:hypothetical protein FRB93_010802 [Tulasnella sp. JGI-2019a]KAG9023279.1 hypothetical protein FRB95_013329 [Tulasnella sp. JGI-2019a]
MRVTDDNACAPQYTILDLIFGILFGRPLLTIISGSKYISPFGLFVNIFGSNTLRRKMRTRYPNLESEDLAHRSVATTEFLHDFALDFGLGVSQSSTSTYTLEGSGSKANDTYDPVHNSYAGSYSDGGHGGYIELEETTNISSSNRGLILQDPMQAC